MIEYPQFPGRIRKNDGIFLYGARCPKPFVYVYEQTCLEIVHGPSCKPEVELDLERCNEDEVSIQERRGGGGTVILAPGVVVTIIVGERKTGESALHIFDNIHNAMIKIFKNEGIDSIRKKGISDLTLQDRKILGSSLYLGSSPSLYYYQSSLLVCADISLMGRYLKYPPREPDYRKGRRHEEFCTTFREQGFSISPAWITELLAQKIPEQLNS